MIHYLRALSCLLLIFLLAPSLCLSDSCSDAILKAMEEAGLPQTQIENICQKADQYQQLFSPTPLDPYTRACSLFEQGKYKEVITELKPFNKDSTDIINRKILLAKAYLAECENLKKADDKSYETLVMNPYNIGKSLYKETASRVEALYIVARSLLINNKSKKALKYIDKAIGMSKEPQPEYYILKGDALIDVSEGRANLDPASAKKYMKKAKAAYQEALKYTEEDSLIKEIHMKLALTG